MIPNFIVNIVNGIASLLGFDTYVTATSGSRFVHSIHLMRRQPGSQRLRVLRPHDGGPLTPA